MKPLLKFLVCGSVDDGKSTLIGHLLYNINAIYTDQVNDLIRTNNKLNNSEIDYSLLLDGLSAEVEQKITIDVAYRFFSTSKRHFIVADTPGHEEYTRNMAVGASFAELSVIMLDVTKGILDQTIRHSRICKMMGIKNYIFIVNKMDLINYDEKTFNKLHSNLISMSKELKLDNVIIIPVSAKYGENLDKKSKKMKWYKGNCFLKTIETIDVEEHNENEFVFPIQRVCRPNASFRGYQGQITSGDLSLGDTIFSLSSGEKAIVKKLYVKNKNSKTAFIGDPVTIQLDKEIDASRGDVFVKNKKVLFYNDFFSSIVFWMSNDELDTNKSYIIQIGTDSSRCNIKYVNYKYDINTNSKIEYESIKKNDIISCDISLDKKMAYSIFDSNNDMGRFIIVDPVSNDTVGCGTIKSNLSNKYVNYQKLDITKSDRCSHMNQKPLAFWFTGLSSSGKSTLANELEKYLFSQGYHTMLLDGDNIRNGLNSDLSFTIKDRSENIRRVAEVVKLMNDAGLIVITSFISPIESDRKIARDIIGDSFIEIYVDTDIEICKQRDKKGLYKKAEEKIIKEFTGVSSPYEIPKSSEIVINNNDSIDVSSNNLIEQIKKYL